MADAEAALVGVGPGRPILEIGGGLGVLTEALLRRGLGPVTVIERDPRLAGFLERTFGGSISVVLGDALEVPWPSAAVVVGNLPFSVATPILARVWAGGIDRFVGMLQREVVDRLVSPPGSKVYGRLTVLAACYGAVEPFQVVASRAFEPAPAVEGRVLVYERRRAPAPVPSVAALEQLLDALFSARRKQLKNLLPRALPRGVDGNDAARAAGWPDDWAGRRPEELAPEEFFRMTRAIASFAPSSPAPRLARQA
ncbi:MAG: 16S rRNA (adenine(1518)-N(6)/adenine(1519)-N(6))-dimethyltransferase [Thermoplasmata archaeon]|nr:16S rRNA (adenine(1518)-N(6)/adenine(1519)-N(6))-dimethyltransferase [Thermoplasmata archaeon]